MRAAAFRGTAQVKARVAPPLMTVDLRLTKTLVQRIRARAAPFAFAVTILTEPQGGTRVGTDFIHVHVSVMVSVGHTHTRGSRWGRLLSFRFDSPCCGNHVLETEITSIINLSSGDFQAETSQTSRQKPKGLLLYYRSTVHVQITT